MKTKFTCKMHSIRRRSNEAFPSESFLVVPSRNFYVTVSHIYCWTFRVFQLMQMLWNHCCSICGVRRPLKQTSYRTEIPSAHAHVFESPPTLDSWATWVSVLIVTWSNLLLINGVGNRAGKFSSSFKGFRFRFRVILKWVLRLTQHVGVCRDAKKNNAN